MTQIIFNSQEEFEDAVMNVLRKRLDIAVDSEENDCCISVRLFDNSIEVEYPQVAYDRG